MAFTHLQDAALEDDLLRGRIPSEALRIARKMLERGFNSPLTSSVGRLFDAVASLAGVRDRVAYEGQAAMQLEWLAEEEKGEGVATYPFDLVADAHPIEVDTRPLIRAIAGDVKKCVSVPVIARRFQSTVVEIIARVCRMIRDKTALDRVALSGGVFMNGLLSTEAASTLEADGFQVYRHRRVPPNDGGLSLGQLSIAACRAKRDDDRRSVPLSEGVESCEGLH
jgi:hydrogenase maturation protein HypF